MVRALVLGILMSFCGTQAAVAGPDRNFVGFSGSLKSHEVNVRAGPGINFPILWVFKMRGYPVKAIARYEHWLNIRDAEGEEGWVHQSFVSTLQTALIRSKEPVTLYKDRDGKKPLLRLESGVLVLLKRCALGLCEVEVSGQEGWIAADKLKQP